MRKLSIALLVATAALAGCTKDQPENPYAGYESAVHVPVRLHQDFYSSWGHDGRGGAALRKPAYQHVMGSEDMVMTTHGNYSDLRSGKGQGDSNLNKAMAGGVGSAITNALNSAPPIVVGTASDNFSSLQHPASYSNALEYEAAYRKFCGGATMTMTEREWEIVALGGPKGIPAQLRGKCMHSK